MQKKEIGSEFWKPIKRHVEDNETCYLSGRTALDIIVKDAVKEHGITSALLPSYCCHTMVEPFITNSIDVRFYDVYVSKDNILTADIPSPGKNEILYVMKYFGDIDLRYEGEGQDLSGWSATVEDLTHSCFKRYYSTNADYWYSSYRKWFPISGIAIAGKRAGRLSVPQKEQNAKYIELRNKAFFLKQRFINGEAVEKRDYLNMFSNAEELLSKDYHDYGAGYEEVHSLFQFMDQIEEIHFKRRRNALILLDGLKDVDEIKIFADFLDEEKCPLFVPIIVRNDKRDVLRNYLIMQDIYCPVHWPLSSQHIGLSERAKEIYGQELSLICDQRYNAEDMGLIIEKIKNFYC